MGGRVEVASINVLLNARKQPGDGKFCLSKLVMFFPSVSWLVAVMAETGGYPEQQARSQRMGHPVGLSASLLLVPFQFVSSPPLLLISY